MARQSVMSSPPGGRLVEPPPLLLKLPPRAVTSAADEALTFAERALGITLDDWQRWVVELALAEQADGTWAAFEVGLVCPRQNGKNFILEVIQIACIYLFGDVTLVHSAHKFDTAVEHFGRLKWLFENTPELSELLLPGEQSFVTSNGKEHIRFNTGQRILFKTRYRGGGRGFTGDKVFLDEAYDLPARAIGALIPTLSTRPMAQVYYTASAPHADSMVLHAVRNRGIADDPDDRLFYAEWGNQDGVDEYDMAAIRQANPAVVAGRISEEYIQQEIRTFSGDPELVEEHRRERLGIASLPPGEGEGIVPNWDHLLDARRDRDGSMTSKIVSHRSIALDVSPNRRFASLAWAGRRADGLIHVEAFHHAPRTDWVVDACVALKEKWNLPIRIQTGSPASSFIDLVVERGVEVVELSTADHAQALGQFLDACATEQLRHIGNLALTTAVRNAVVRAAGDADIWARRKTSTDITPLVAVTLALGGVPAPETGLVFAY
jgi:phage terminase large subunit-like protein